MVAVLGLNLPCRVKVVSNPAQRIASSIKNIGLGDILITQIFDALV
jgi:hypothetical protein